MENQNILSGGVPELNQLKELLVEQASLRRNTEKLIAEKSQIEKNTELLERQLKEKQEATIKNRRSSLMASFDRELQKDQSRLKDIKSKREKAKKKGMEKRIEEETAELRKKNNQINDEIKTTFKQKGVPRFCNTTFYYALFFPKNIKEILILLLTAFLVFVGCPWTIWQIMDAHAFWKVIVCVFFIALFGVIYFLVFAYTKDKYAYVLEEQRVKRKDIAENKKEIRQITRKIKKDKNEEQYQLSSFDEEIKEIEGRMDILIQNKNAALAEFERDTLPAIVEEINRQELPKIEQMKQTLTETSAQILSQEGKQKEVTQRITSNYEAFMGADYMKVEAIDVLLRMIEEGRVATIGEALIFLAEQNAQGNAVR